ncbi:hypothetical protein QMZ30_16030 [Pantoea sp. EA-12]|uniref:hypothetical protein n=1 Tax=Pantoea sp. EA-12 TaxID=3043303 RepID=UPI0024B5C914|nr:hypothetical protein [Pantoea sp. EA-12]MDI9222416.1 hypothetical protein [Pantoea sp. EA-12]
MDASRIAAGIWDSIRGMPRSLYYGVKRTYISTGALGSERKIRNEREAERFYHVIKSLIQNEEPIRRLITLVITEFYHKLDEQGKQAINSQLSYSAGRFTGRFGGQIIASQVIATTIVKRARASYAWRTLYGAGASFTFSAGMWQGLIEEAALASRRMQNHYSRMYWKVQPQGLDMIYFVVEDQLKPYLEYINSHPYMCKRISNEICKLAG